MCKAVQSKFYYKDSLWEATALIKHIDQGETEESHPEMPQPWCQSVNLECSSGNDIFQYGKIMCVNIT